MRRLFLLVAAALAAVPARAKIQVVSTTADLAALAREVGGDAVEVESIAKGYQDPHFVEAKPSYLLKLKRADLFLQVGLGLEAGWAPALLANARNPRILPGTHGFLDASEGVAILGSPKGSVDRALGDVHPYGNPHYWLDPGNGRAIARKIAERLKTLDAAAAAKYEASLARFEERLERKEKEWAKAAAALKGVQIVTYHDSWPHFARYFGLAVVGFVEPRPGVPPSPAHVQALTALMRERRVPLLIIEPYFDEKLPAKIARDSGSRLVVLPPSVGAEDGVATYFDLFDRSVAVLTQALAAGRAP